MQRIKIIFILTSLSLSLQACASFEKECRTIYGVETTPVEALTDEQLFYINSCMHQKYLEEDARLDAFSNMNTQFQLNNQQQQIQQLQYQQNLQRLRSW